MTDWRKKKGRVSRPELKAMVAFVNKYTPESGVELSFPLPKQRLIIFLECRDNKYEATHHFDIPKQAKEFLVQLMNSLIADYGLKIIMANKGEVTIGIPSSRSA